MASSPATVPTGQGPFLRTSWAVGLYLQPRRPQRAPFVQGAPDLAVAALAGAVNAGPLAAVRAGPAIETRAPLDRPFWGGLPLDQVDGVTDPREFGGLVCVRIMQSVRRVLRSGDGERPDPDYCHVLFQLTGQSNMAQAGGEAVLGPGSLVIVRPGFPIELRFGGRNSMLVLRVRQSDLARAWPAWDASAGVAMSSPSARIVGSLVQSAFDNATGRAAAQDLPLRDSILSLLARAASEAGTEAIAGGSESARESQLLQRVQDLVLRSLGDADLSPAGIAAAIPMSERRLHRLFAATGTTLCRWIQQRRLDRCAADLANPDLREVSITEIAFRWGFNDSAYFSRVFKKAFNLSPREFRAGGLAG